MTVKRTWTVENTWTCDSCHAKNLGRHVTCQTCGSPKEKQEKDTVPNPDRTVPVTDPELLRLAKQKANSAEMPPRLDSSVISRKMPRG